MVWKKVKISGTLYYSDINYLHDIEKLIENMLENKQYLEESE